MDKIKDAVEQARAYLDSANGQAPTQAAGVYALMAIGTLLAALAEHIAESE
jgi:hypothetical protein